MFIVQSVIFLTNSAMKKHSDAPGLHIRCSWFQWLFNCFSQCLCKLTDSIINVITFFLGSVRNPFLLHHTGNNKSIRLCLGATLVFPNISAAWLHVLLCLFSKALNMAYKSAYKEAALCRAEEHSACTPSCNPPAYFSFPLHFISGLHFQI